MCVCVLGGSLRERQLFLAVGDCEWEGEEKEEEEEKEEKLTTGDVDPRGNRSTRREGGDLQTDLRAVSGTWFRSGASSPAAPTVARPLGEKGRATGRLSGLGRKEKA